MSSTPPEINIITLNCWGLKYIAKYRNQRLSEIGRRIAIAEPVPHIVGLQECWTHEDYQNIRKNTKHVLPYGKFYHSGIFGGGLAILSRWPIVESSMFRYPLNGRPTAFFRGDWYVGKGVACASIQYGENSSKDIIEVFNTHMHAPYEREPNDSYLCHRTAQAWEISKLFRGAAERGHLVVGLGDFNMVPQSLGHRLITTHSPVKDAWLSLYPNSSIGAADDPQEKARQMPMPSADYNIKENGITCDSILNTWRWTKDQQKLLGPDKPGISISLDKMDSKAKRLDYIFISSNPQSTTPEQDAFFIKSARVGMLFRHPTLQCSLSDHFSVEATIAYSKYNDSVPSKYEPNIMNGVYLQSPRSSIFRPSTKNSKKYLPIYIYDEVLDLIHKYRRREQQQRRARLLHFVASLILSAGSTIAIWWISQRYIIIILMIFNALNLSAGVIDGLIGGLFMGSEIRALKEFEWEISNAKAISCGESHSISQEDVKDW
ncbi:Inositol phosphosphingolipids phospholipase C [Erysiphe necator]|uniref:Putative inositol phosphosphingolipids phospholipase c protein n=1 Tax=Uncinula necator TaxID=52586 RepID=A0A0B1PEL3_UNCNE|nr:Inositol phosphosphingolipids phospholipase C [Erysiphe necator]KHJ35331.1 putative inositol phosphosphingolipids phospholipase c protein [Erysiphe necator]